MGKVPEVDTNAKPPLPSAGTIVYPPITYAQSDPMVPQVFQNILACLTETQEVNSWVCKVHLVDGYWRAKLPSKHGGGLVCLVEWDGDVKAPGACSLRILRHGSQGTVVFAEIIWPEEQVFGKGVLN